MSRCRSAFMSMVCLAACLLLAQAIPLRSSLHLKGHARVMIEDALPSTQASEQPEPDMSLHETHSSVYYHGYERPSEASATDGEQASAPWEEAGWSSDQAAAQTHDSMYYKYKVPPAPDAPEQGAAIASAFSGQEPPAGAFEDTVAPEHHDTETDASSGYEEAGPDMSFSEAHTTIYWHGYGPRDEGLLASLDEGYGLDEPDMTFSEVHSEIYWHGYRRNMPGALEAGIDPLDVAAPTPEAAGDESGPDSEAASDAVSSPHYQMPDRPPAPSDPPADTSAWDGRRHRRSLLEQVGQRLQKGAEQVVNLVTLPWH